MECAQASGKVLVGARVGEVMVVETDDNERNSVSLAEFPKMQEDKKSTNSTVTGADKWAFSPEQKPRTSRLSQWVVPRCKGTVDEQPVMDVTVKQLKVDEMTTGCGIESTLSDTRVPYCRVNDNEKLTEFQHFEPFAAKKYSHMNGSGHAVRLEKCGLVIDPKAWSLGASPDRKVVDFLAESPFGILDMKCPEKQKDEDPLTACHDPHFCCKLEGGKPVLKKDHPYYTQVQGQLALTGAEWCNFVVCTHKGLIIQQITFDSAFWNTLYKKLADVYFGF
ncbi:uncharacterized protein LOC110990241 [Acanthaster planci]|uniref:Uncharacterized protein LOC110990241 n=1 Tax=Acanthaster planci TaxID=133434 RepID=A0A8B7ZZG4_ACAPL|nr:uncharacterized protein LOC110990241 [Acanthaster planci]